MISMELFVTLEVRCHVPIIYNARMHILMTGLHCDNYVIMLSLSEFYFSMQYKKVSFVDYNITMLYI